MKRKATGARGWRRDTAHTQRPRDSRSIPRGSSTIDGVCDVTGACDFKFRSESSAVVRGGHLTAAVAAVAAAVAAAAAAAATAAAAAAAAAAATAVRRPADCPYPRPLISVRAALFGVAQLRGGALGPPAAMAMSSDDVNYLVYKYLLESGAWAWGGGQRGAARGGRETEASAAPECLRAMVGLGRDASGCARVAGMRASRPCGVRGALGLAGLLAPHVLLAERRGGGSGERRAPPRRSEL